MKGAMLKYSYTVNSGTVRFSSPEVIGLDGRCYNGQISELGFNTLYLFDPVKLTPYAAAP